MVENEKGTQPVKYSPGQVVILKEDVFTEAMYNRGDAYARAGDSVVIRACVEREPGNSYYRCSQLDYGKSFSVDDAQIMCLAEDVKASQLAEEGSDAKATNQ